jgi:signal transduction histidine kinase
VTRLRLGLRGRVSLSFAIGALGLSLLLALTTHGIASRYLTEQRYDTVLRQAAFNARAVDAALSTSRPAVRQLLERLEASAGEASSPLAWVHGRWFSDQLPGGLTALPRAFVAAVEDGRAVQQRFTAHDGLVVAIALPLADDAAYVEVFSLRELDQVLTTLGITFTGTATMTTLLGLLLGLWASRRALRPLSEVTAAARAIAEGDLGARLQGREDPDLESIATAFNRTATRLQRRVESDARFAGNVSHELRTPVTTMVNAVDLLETRAGRLTGEGREVLGLLATEVHRFAQMVEDLLEISRADAGEETVTLEPTEIGAFVPRVADRAAGRPVTVVDPGVAHLPPEDDRRRLDRAISNLVHNAEQHGDGVTAVRVRLRGTGPDARLRICVEDEGPGVAADQRERVFERFSRGPGGGTGTRSGAGLGLSLVAGHVRLLSGQVWVEDNEPRGARFVVELPVQP